MQQTMAKPLSGVEVRTAILKDIERMLELDDRFHGHVAYDGFLYKLSLSVTFPSAPQSLQQVERELSGGGGEPLESNTETVLVEVSRALEPPDKVRMDTDQGIPTLVEEAGHLVEKTIPYAGKDLKGRTHVPRQNDTKPPLTVKGA